MTLINEKQKMRTLKLISSRTEAGNIRTFIFETGGIMWTAGQSLACVLPQAGVAKEENQRWFTIASAPSEGAINIATRISGSKFKQALNALKPGDQMQTYGLSGDFVWEEKGSERVVFVAGGIGVTPYRSILLERKAVGKPLNATLLYFNRTTEIAFENEFRLLGQDHREFVLKNIIGEHISAEKILELAPQSKKQIVYLSGPEPMVESIGTNLRELGVSIKQDWFPGYDENNY